MTNSSAAMTALVEYQVRTEEITPADWLRVWQERALDALEAEPETLGYAAAVSLEDESSFLFYEHYVNGTASLKLHMDRPSHTTLTETMGARRMTRRRVMSTGFFDLPGFGWRGRGDNPLIQSDAVIVLSGLRFDDEAEREEYLRKATDFADYCFSEEPDTLIYTCGIAARDADRGPDIKQGDALFFMVCTDMTAVEKHQQDPKHLALSQHFTHIENEAGRKLTTTFQKMYRTTGHGFLTKVV